MGWVPTRRGTRRASSFSRAATRISLALCLITGAIGAIAQPASAAPTWSLATAPTPAGTPLSSFANVACAGTTVCFAVGQFTFDFDQTQSVIKRWNGTAWAVVAVPNPAGATSTSLTGVRCQSATQCFAVGTYRTLTAIRTLIYRWTSTAGWALMTSPNPVTVVDLNLTSIACPSATSCYAVGYFDNGANVKTLVLQWNGTTWAIQASPNGASSETSALMSVACPSLTSCYAVGNYSTASAQRTLVLRYNGTTWALSASPNPAGTFAGLNSIACYTATGCIAVGGYSTASADKTLIERWNGTAWAIMASPNAAGTSSVLKGVACVSNVSCQAVGESITTAEKTLIERFNGTAWTIIASPNPAGTTDNVLNGIHCVGATFCLAAGGSAAATGLNTLMERWNGTAWAVAATPAIAGAAYGFLNSVSCPSATLCMAVGQYNTGFQTRPTTAKFNGTTWTSVASPVPAGATSTKLLGVSCRNITLCIAVGSYTTSAGEKTLIQRWNGTAWSILASPNVSGAESNVLAGVDCAGPTSCLAVGHYVKVGVTKTLAQRWNGTIWNTMVSANPAGSDPVMLESISCPSLTSCFAVGNYSTVSDERALVERWNGTAWAVMATPVIPTAGLIGLNSVSCPSLTLCFAAGYQTIGATTTTLIETWNGTAWSIMTSANPAGATDSQLNGISCPTVSACFAVGRYDTAAGNVTLVEQWTGTTWSIVSSPNGLNTTGSSLNAVDCRTDMECKSVGDNRVVGNRRSLILSAA